MRKLLIVWIVALLPLSLAQAQEAKKAPAKSKVEASAGPGKKVSQKGAHHGHEGAHQGHDGARHGHDGAHHGHDGARHGHEGAHHGHEGAHHGHDGAHHGHEVLPSAPHSITKDSLYVLGGKLRDTEGQEVTLGELQGKPILLTMFYASCPKACPLLISDLKRIESKLDEKTRKDLRIVMVSFDPERDTVEKLAALRTAHGVDQGRWSMLRTDEEFVEELAAVLGIRYRFAADGSIHHSTVITLLDRSGVIVERVEGLRQPSDGLISRLNEL